MPKTSVKDFYNKIARRKIKGDEWFFINTLIAKTQFLSEDRNVVVGRIISSGDKYLDVGIGSGIQLMICIDSFNKLYGIDISPERIGHLKKKKEFNKFYLSVQNIESRTKYQSGFFDTVTMVAVLEHVFDPHIVLKEARRILKYEGELIIEVPNMAWLPRRLSLFFGHFPLTSTDPGFDGGHLHYFEKNNLTKLLNEHGFSVELVVCSGFLSKIRKLWPTLLGGDIIIKARKRKISTPC